MQKRNQTVVRRGSIYHVTINGSDYALFIWSNGKHFCGRVEGQPHVPEQAATTAEKVRAALCNLLTLPAA
jgi:hypothetical protein